MSEHKTATVNTKFGQITLTATDGDHIYVSNDRPHGPMMVRGVPIPCPLISIVGQMGTSISASRRCRSGSVRVRPST